LALSSALYDAILADNLKLCEDLVEQNAELNLPVSEMCNGCTPLLVALRNRRVEVAELLIRKGATLSGEACERTYLYQGYTVLHFAVMNDKFAVILDLLLERSSILSWVSCPVHPVHVAVANFNNRALGKLLASCAQASHGRLGQRFTDGPTAWKIDISKGFSSLTEVQIWSLDLSWTWSLSFDVSTHDISSGTPLHVAALVDNDDAVKLLLEHGAFIDSLDDQGRTPLHVAADSGSFDVAELLLSHAANPNARDKTLKTPIMLAAAKGQEDILRLLKNSGADLALRSLDGDTTLYFGLDFPNVLALLLENRCCLYEEDYYGNALILEAFRDKKTCSQSFILNSDVDITACTVRHGGILQSVALSESATLLKHILRRLPQDAMARLVNFRAQIIGSPLYISATRGHTRNTELLIEAGAMVELEGGRLGTPLMGACEAGHLQTAKILVRRGAKLVYPDKNGEEVSALALAKHYPLLVQWLLVWRHTEQLKLCNQPDDGAGVVPWVGFATVEVFRPRAYGLSLLDYLLELGEFSKRYLGKVYYPVE